MLPKTSLIIYLCLSVTTSGFGIGETFPPSPNSPSRSASKSEQPYLSSATQYATDFGTGSSVLSKSATGSRLLNPEEGFSNERGSEYISGYYKGAVLMPVRLWGAVGQAGLHHIPYGTDLLQLITLAGGPKADAELDSVTIKRVGKNGFEVIKVNLEDLVNSSDEQGVELQPNDVVILPAAKPLIGTNTLTLIGVITSVVGIVASSVLIANQVK